MKTALFPGSFDPVTVGHVDIIKRVLPLFDKIVIGIGDNSQKQYLFPIEKRIAWIRKIFENDNNVEVQKYEGLTIHFCREIKAGFIIRGLRNSSDFEFEKNIAQLNQSMAEDIDTILITTRPQYSHISSTIVREIIRYGGDVSHIVPKEIISEIKSFLT